MPTAVLERAVDILKHVPLDGAVITRTNDSTYSSVKVVLETITLHIGHDSVLIESGKNRTLHYEFVVGHREKATAWKRFCYKNWHDLLSVLIAVINKHINN